MKSVRALIILAGCICIHSALYAQNEWTLEQCVNYARENNISVRQQSLSTEQSRNSLLQSQMALLPTIGANASYQVRWGRAETLIELSPGSGNYVPAYVDNVSQNFSPSISASVNLFDGFQKINTVKRNKAEYEAAQQNVEQIRNQISLEIARAYLQVLLAREMLAAAEKSRESAEQQRSVTEKLVQAGSRPHGSLLEIEAQLASEEVQCVNAHNNVDIAYLSLRQLLDIAPEAEFTIAVPEIDVNMISRDESVRAIYGVALELPQIKAAKFREQSAIHALSVARGGYFPSLSLSGSYGAWSNHSNQASSPDLWTQLTQNASPVLGLNLSIPIFQNWNIVTNAKNASLNRRIASLELESRQNALYKEIQQAVADASAAYNRFRASERNAAAMQESLRYTQQKFEVGSVNATDYTVAKNNLFKAQSDMLQAKYQYVFQIKIIEFYKGNQLTLQAN